MSEILDEEILEQPDKEESNLHWRALTYVIVMLVGGMLYGRFFTFNGSNAFATSITFLLIAIALMMVAELVKWLIRIIRSRDLKLKYPIWFEITENTMGYWVWIIAISMVSRLI